MSVWSIGSLDEEQKKKLGGALSMGSFEAPTATVDTTPSAATQAGASIAGQGVGAMATPAITAALAATPLAPFAPFIGPALGGMVTGALSGGGGGPQATAPKFDGGSMVADNKSQDTSVKIAGNVPQQAAPLNPQMKDQMAFDEEEYMRKFGGGNYA